MLDGVGGWVAGRVFVVYGAPLDVCYERWGAPYGRVAAATAARAARRGRIRRVALHRKFFYLTLTVGDQRHV